MPSANSAARVAPRDLELTPSEYAEFQGIIRELTGITMGDSKRQLVHRRLTARLRALGLSSFRDYINYLRKGDAEELEAFTNSVTTNLTAFFRESHHFDYFANTILPEVSAKKASKRLRVWSAGCSTGEEPYSIAITLKESLANLSDWDARLLATDIDSDVLRTCRAGRYADQRVEKVPPGKLKRWFRQVDGGEFELRNDVKSLITFNQLNLMNEWPMRGKFDVIFCRNVIIYFDKPTQRVLIDRYANILEDGGYLILGHSESLFNVTDRFSLIGQTIYKKLR